MPDFFLLSYFNILMLLYQNMFVSGVNNEFSHILNSRYLINPLYRPDIGPPTPDIIQSIETEDWCFDPKYGIWGGKIKFRVVSDEFGEVLFSKTIE